MSNRRFITLIGAALLAAAPATAQTADPVPVGVGSRVRISTTEGPGTHRVTGTLLAMDDRVIRIRPDGTRTEVDVFRSSIDVLEVSAGKTSRGKAALRGAAIGAALGVVIGLIGGEDNCGNRSWDFACFERGEAAALGGLGFGLFGLGFGALLGGGHDRWVTTDPGRVRISVLPGGPGGFTLGTTIRW